MIVRTIPAALAAQRGLRPLAIVVALAAVVAVRWAIVVGDRAPALATGVGFGALLVAIAVSGGARIRFSGTAYAAIGSIAAGILGGLILVGLALSARPIAGPVPGRARVTAPGARRPQSQGAGRPRSTQRCRRADRWVVRLTKRTG